MLSIGGITYTNDWDTALNTNPTQLGTYAAQAAQRLGVGIEIDYENNTSPNLTALQSFISAYRAILPYDATGANPAARLTIDLAAGDQYLVAIAAKATTDWLNASSPVLDYANAMVPNKQPTSASATESNWQQHISGYPRITPPVPPLAPAKNDGKPVCRDREESGPGMHHVQQFAGKLYGDLRANRRTHGRGNNTGLTQIYILGGGVPGHAFDLHHTAKHLPGRSRRGRQDLQRSLPDARAAAELKDAAHLLTS